MKAREIEIANNVNWLAFNENEVSSVCTCLDKFGKYAVKDGIISIAFLDEREMCDVHEKFLKYPCPTDVITFCGDEEFGYTGEICVSPTYARQACKEFKTSFSDELTLYIVHGYLHLSGLDDIEEIDRLKMRQAEKFCMKFLRSQGAIPNFVDRENFISL
ncbi:MAG: rRNA maturation RNase YbeY [Puniceicoccales bacterium]|jgi:probable rRNA maturation factor|nr:rRNA maturation RNase YbeY [Puniceicoccales bacterium]